MGKKKKPKDKGRRLQIADMSLTDMTEIGTAALDAGKPRYAIDHFKMAAKTYGKSDELNYLLFRAYLMREDHLRKKGMNTEADVVRKQAAEHFPGFDKLSAVDLKNYILTSSAEDAFRIYAKYISAYPGSSEIEQVLANHLFASGKWELIHQLNETASLCRDAVPVQEAVSLMKKGRWEDAMTALRPIPMSSPFATVRLFCRAMVSFYKGDNADMLKAISMIPNNFPLSRVLTSLRDIAFPDTSSEKRTEASKITACLWECPIFSKDDVKNLFDDSERGQYDRVSSLISDMGETIYPTDPNAVKSFILELIQNRIMHSDRFGMTQEKKFGKIASMFLTPEQKRVLMAKIHFSAYPTSFTAAGQYISLLELEFPDSETRKTAHALVLFHLVSIIIQIRKYVVVERMGIEKYGKLLGIPPVNDKSDPETVIAGIVKHCIDLDPLWHKSYELAASLPRHSRSARQVVEGILTSMAQYFPNDPYPCIELASVHYENNAFRKAETVLEEAMKRSPHDSRVIDRHAISLLFSAEKNYNRDKSHLVEKDMDRALKLDTKKARLIVIEKKILFRMPVQAEDFNLILSEELKALSVYDQLRLMAILITDIRNRSFKNRKIIEENLKNLIKKGLETSEALSSADIIKILTPLEKEYKTILPLLNIAPVVLEISGNILEKIKDSDIIAVYEMILESELFIKIGMDIDRRIPNMPLKDSHIFRFFFSVIQQIHNKTFKYVELGDIAGQASGQILEEMRGLSRRLSAYASDPLRTALENFEFGIPDYDDDEDYDEDEDMFDPDELGMSGIGDFMERVAYLLSAPDTWTPEDVREEAGKIISLIEKFIDMIGIRNAPESVLKDIRKSMKSGGTMMRDFDLLAKFFDKADVARTLSRQARIFLYGKKGVW